LALKCIESWKKYCPDYTIIEWNEDSFDINTNQYVKEAYENKKWAFVSDYVRLFALYHEGGVYMDTDVECLKSLDNYLIHDAFSGFESYDRIPTGIMAAQRHDKNIKALLDEYEDRKFVMEDGSLDLTTNVTTITNYFKTKGIVLNNTLQNIDGFVFYPSEYFCPKDSVTKKLNLTDNTATIHHFDGSWVPKSRKIKQYIINILGKRITKILVNIKSRMKKRA